LQECVEDEIKRSQRLHLLLTQRLKFLRHSRSQGMKRVKILGLPLLLEELPQALNRVELRAMSRLKNWDDILRPLQPGRTMSRRSVHLHHRHCCA